MGKVAVRVKNVYGTDLVYPANEVAALFAALIKAKTFNAQQLGLIKSLGHEVCVVAGELPFTLD